MNIYTDGSCRENFRENGVAKGIGGWAFIILEENLGQDMRVVIENCGQKIGTTNQEMELQAAIEALDYVGNNCENSINLYSDSTYLINCLKNKWFDKWLENGWLNSKLKPVENRELWEKLILQTSNKNINFFHIKRNSTKFNREVDVMARLISKSTSQQ